MRIAKAFGLLAAILALSLTFGGPARADEPVLGYYGHLYVDLQSGTTTWESGVPFVAGDKYNNTTTSALFALASTDLTSVWGDRVTTTGTGILDQQVITVFNSGASAGNLITGTFSLGWYDGATSALLGSGVGGVNFGAGVPPGFFAIVTFTGISAFNINLNTTDVLVTQQLSGKTGTANTLGVVSYGAPTIGTSGPDMYINSSTFGPAGFYTFPAAGPANPGYRIATIDPVPTQAVTWGKVKDGYR